jgi:hypothetical protein
MAKPEQDLQLQICQYLRLQYPRAIFFSEPSGLRVSIGQAVILKKMRSFGKLPDMFIAFPNGKYHGFFIELKVEGTTIWKKDGELVADKHIQEQFKTLKTLYELGYAATFCCGFDQCKKKIDGYFAMQNVKPMMPGIDFPDSLEHRIG